MARNDKQAKSNVPKPFDFDGPFEDKDPFGANHYVEVRFLNRAEANAWIEAQYRKMDTGIEVYEEPLSDRPKGIFARMFGL